MSRRSVWIVALGAALLGMGVVYFLDPAVGPSRRRALLGRLGAAAVAYEPLEAGGDDTAAAEGEPSGGAAMLVRDVDSNAVSFPYPPANGAAAAPHRPALPEGPQQEIIVRDRRLSGPVLVGLAAVLALAAIGVGTWAFVAKSSSPSHDVQVPSQGDAGLRKAVALLAAPSAKQIAVTGSAGKMVLVVGAHGDGVLVLNGFAHAPAGKTYEAWVIRPSVKAPTPAGTFGGGEVAVPLAATVPPGATVAVTVERAGGVPAPTQTPRLLAQRA